MKTIFAFALPAALTAFAFLVPLSFEATVSTVFAGGFLGIHLADYSRILRPARLNLTPVNFSTQRSERLRLAA